MDDRKRILYLTLLENFNFVLVFLYYFFASRGMYEAKLWPVPFAIAVASLLGPFIPEKKHRRSHLVSFFKKVDPCLSNISFRLPFNGALGVMAVGFVLLFAGI
jgi:hypothetical protein